MEEKISELLPFLNERGQLTALPAKHKKKNKSSNFGKFMKKEKNK